MPKLNTNWDELADRNSRFLDVGADADPHCDVSAMQSSCFEPPRRASKNWLLFMTNTVSRS